MKRRPSRLATTAVVPAPMKGSRTIPGSKPCLHLQPNTSGVLLVSVPLRRNLLPACSLAALRLPEIDLVSIGVPQRLAIDLMIPDDELAAARSSSFGAPLRLRLRPGVARVAVGVWDAVGGVGSYIAREFELSTEAP